MPPNIRTAGPSDHDGVASLYAEAGYGAPIGADDTVLVASIDGRIAGAVRLCPEGGVSVLRGMQVGKRFQRQGIGTLLLAACRPYLDGRESFCLPYAHLLPFYASSGFQASGPAELLDFLARRLASYRARGQDVLAMRRPPA